MEVRLGISPVSDVEPSPQLSNLTFVSSDVNESGEPALRIWQVGQGDLFYLKYCDGMQFWVDRGGESIWAMWPQSSTLEDAATYLLGPVLGFTLRLRGVACLHASAVALEDRAVAFVGDAGSGKSTTAAAFARQGEAVISDDIVALIERDHAFWVMPAYPYLSLWPESVKMLYGPDKTLPRFSPNWDKRLLSLAENRLRFENRLLTLGAVILLGERSSNPAAPLLETLTAQEGFVALVANSYATGLLNKVMRAHEFSLLGRLLANVPVRRVRPHDDPARIGRLCDLIGTVVGAKNAEPSYSSKPEPPPGKLGD